MGHELNFDQDWIDSVVSRFFPEKPRTGDIADRTQEISPKSPTSRGNTDSR
ncbi:hypothetical protein JW899_03150 [Candidatus Uhrbacteria bacterium]|nr:hypothetical protein [Candidatus Uhrbacteria bacterium]